MDRTIRENLDNLFSTDRESRYNAFMYLLKVTEKPVDWAYTVWDELLQHLSHHDNHVRAIAAQLLCNLAKSDPEQRMIEDFDRVLAVTRDERFVTARHSLQSIWKAGAAGKDQQLILLAALEYRFDQCVTEKNCTLIRFDIIQGLRKLYGEVKDEEVRDTAMALIESESDLKYRKKYAKLWKNT